MEMSKSPKSDFELYVINQVREKRVSHKMSQDDLAVMLDTDRSFIGQVESRNNPSKYNLNHLNKLAIEFGCSPRDFLPENPIAPAPKKKNAI
jgi:transcriptional regulator with XRE-family HTH domain